MKALGALAGIMKNKDRIREIGEEFQRRIARISVDGEAGGGAVRATISGKLRVTDIHLDPALIAGMAADDDGRQTAESLIREAINNGLDQAQALIQHETQRMARELDLPEVPGMERLLGGGGGGG